MAETKTKIHTVYKVADGTKAPSVTTVLGILNKPALLDWAWRLGCEGVDYKAVRDNAADIGTLAHYLILCDLKKQKPDTSEYSPADVDKAENCLIKYYGWLKEHPIEPVLVEEPLVSERFGFGGTIDCLAKLNGDLILIDHKTGKSIYDEMFYQLAAYKALLNEHGHDIKSCRILRIGRENTGDFEERIINDLDKQWQVFLACLSIYKLKRSIKSQT